ncbi:unnamed protein product [Leptidea sinapis]|uniref:G-protein coupled receptors family 1 profile domain-containing protein n=1 Tax=Leptidea sinapis TaxID=189913 RepID=A0A5E4QD27_9NEOP|nr:unnamed protein product [Leptidea sinapis]
MEDYNDTLFLLNETEVYLPYSQRVETYVVPILFAFIFIIGVLGNGALVAVFIRHKAMRNVPNTYILSLALADLLVIVTCVPFTSIVYTVESWPWGATVCRLSEAAKDFLVCYPYPVEWGEEYARLVVLLKFLIYYSMPLAVIALFYVLMARHLVLSTQNMPGEMQGTQRQRWFTTSSKAVNNT